MVKVMAYYLPQYHETEENNAWWGKGFTEWTSVRDSRPLYYGHYQPVEPLDDNYYDLTDSGTWRWQAELARKYFIYGFCIHHYWFKRKQVLPKPAELLLKNKDINIRYCFSWANESWTRTWSRSDGNVWSTKMDAGKSRGKDGMLLLQEYGTVDDWTDHFNYLLRFFMDDRYIKEGNKPMLLIYHPEKIQCLHSMLKTWNWLAIQNGFDGLYIVSTNDLMIQDINISANAIFEPPFYFNSGIGFMEKSRLERVMKNRRHGKDSTLFLSYKKIWDDILKRKYQSVRKTYLGGLVSFDKTPREGKNATIYLGANPRRFKRYFDRLVKKSLERGNEYVFINAWNEWGEGCALEPNKKYQYAYLEAIQKSVEEN